MGEGRVARGARRIGGRLGAHLRANLVAYLALFVALGGTGAWAADKITSKDIKKNAVRSKHIKKDQVKAKQVKIGSVKPSLGIRSSRRVDLDAAVPPTQRVLARSGPITLYGTCEDIGGGSDSVLWVRSSTDSGSLIGVEYTDGAGGAPELDQVEVNLSQAGALVTRAAAFVGPLDAGVSFTATVGSSTLSGQARTSPTVGGCGLSFNGLAG